MAVLEDKKQRLAKLQQLQIEKEQKDEVKQANAAQCQAFGNYVALTLSPMESNVRSKVMSDIVGALNRPAFQG